MSTLKTTVFAKKRQTKEGKTFYSYLTKLTKKDGSEVTATVKFRDDGTGAPKPEACPLNIEIDKEGANFTSKTIQNATTGDYIQSNTLWVKTWTAGEAYKDNSMDEFI